MLDLGNCLSRFGVSQMLIREKIVHDNRLSSTAGFFKKGLDWSD